MRKSEFYKIVADLLKEENVKFYGPYGIKAPDAADILSFSNWSKLADKLNLEEDCKHQPMHACDMHGLIDRNTFRNRCTLCGTELELSWVSK